MTQLDESMGQFFYEDVPVVFAPMLEAYLKARQGRVRFEFLPPLHDRRRELAEHLLEAQRGEFLRTFAAVKVNVVDPAFTLVFVNERKGRAIHFAFAGSAETGGNALGQHRLARAQFPFEQNQAGRLEETRELAAERQRLLGRVGYDIIPALAGDNRSLRLIRHRPLPATCLNHPFAQSRNSWSPACVKLSTCGIDSSRSPASIDISPNSWAARSPAKP